jgi:3-oxoacyl-[acyl-carrier-protein] synthase-3
MELELHHELLTMTKWMLSYESGTYAMDEANYLFFGKSYNTELDPDTRYIKMHGRKIYDLH